MHIIEHTIIDSLKLLPFLFLAFLFIEFFEHKVSNKSKEKLANTKRFGPILGSIFGIFPQCGFSVIATNLYITRIITLGTLISIYLATSDEMLPILIAEHTEISLILKILLIKIIVGMAAGFLIDLFIKNKETTNYYICEEDHCHCEKSILKSSIIHTLKTFLFIFIITFFINIIFHYFGEDYLKELFKSNNFLTPFITALVGLIPNCASSVLLTELLINNVLSLGATMAGLLTGSGVGLLVLFKTNKNLKENLKIIGILYIIGVAIGLIIELIESFM